MFVCKARVNDIFFNSSSVITGLFQDNTIFNFNCYAGQAFVELSKEKSSLKQAEAQTQQFLKTLGHVESKLSEQINYLTQVSTGENNLQINETIYIDSSNPNSFHFISS